MKTLFLLTSFLGSTGFLVLGQATEAMSEAIKHNGTIGAFGVLCCAVIVMFFDRKRILEELKNRDNKLEDLYETWIKEHKRRSLDEAEFREKELPVRLKEAESKLFLAQAIESLASHVHPIRNVLREADKKQGV